MENEGHSTEVRFWLGHITCAHMYAQSEEYLLNTSAVISKTNFEQRGMLHQDYELLGCNKIVKILGIHKQSKQ